MISRLMKYLLLVFVSLTACKKNETLPTIEEYLAANNLTNSVVKDQRGFYYKIQEPGSGTTPTLTSRVKTLYRGMLTNGKVFDESLVTPIEFTLNGVIEGWQYGIPLIKPGGKITLYIPPSLGYGPYGNPPIPGNAGLIFEVTLIAAN